MILRPYFSLNSRWPSRKLLANAFFMCSVAFFIHKACEYSFVSVLIVPLYEIFVESLEKNSSNAYSLKLVEPTVKHFSHLSLRDLKSFPEDLKIQLRPKISGNFYAEMVFWRSQFNFIWLTFGIYLYAFT